MGEDEQEVIEGGETKPERGWRKRGVKVREGREEKGPQPESEQRED